METNGWYETARVIKCKQMCAINGVVCKLTNERQQCSMSLYGTVNINFLGLSMFHLTETKEIFFYGRYC